MKLDYELKKQDYIDFNVYHMKNSNVFKKSLFLQRFILPITFIVFPFFLVRVSEIPFWYLFIAFTVTTILWMLFYEKHIMTSTMKRISKMIDEGKNTDLLGKHTIIINEEGLIDKSNCSENKVKWGSVERIVATGEHFFIYLSSISACIIPKRAFETEDSGKEFFLVVNNKITGN